MLVIGILNSMEEPTLHENLSGKTVLSISQDSMWRFFRKSDTGDTSSFFQERGAVEPLIRDLQKQTLGSTASTSLSKQEIATQILDFCQTLLFLRFHRGLSYGIGFRVKR